MGDGGGISLASQSFEREDPSSVWDVHKIRLQKYSSSADALVRVLTQLKNEAVAKMFFSKLPQFLDFKTASASLEIKKANYLLTLEVS